MHFNDLDYYECLPGVRSEGMYAIGWLDNSHPYPTGSVDSEFVKMLHSLFCGDYRPDVDIRANLVRGYERCHICKQPAFVDCHCRQTELGSTDLLIPSGDIVYVSPNLILHYISGHNYKPPEVYVQAVLAMKDCRSFNADVVYNTRPLIK